MPFRSSMLLRRSSALSALLLTAVALLPVQFASAEGNPELHQQRKEQMQQQLKSRLKLSDSQAIEVNRILKQQREATRQIFEKAGITRKGFKALERKEKRALLKELRPLRQQTEQQLKRVLSAEQMDAYKAMQKARQGKLKEHRKPAQDGRGAWSFASH